MPNYLLNSLMPLSPNLGQSTTGGNKPPNGFKSENGIGYQYNPYLGDYSPISISNSQIPDWFNTLRELGYMSNQNPTPPYRFGPPPKSPDWMRGQQDYQHNLNTRFMQNNNNPLLQALLQGGYNA